MGHVGVICPNTTGHLNAMMALGNALRRRGHRVSFFLLGDPPASVTSAGFEVVPLGGSVFPPDEYRAGFERLGVLDGRAALKHTIAMGARGRGHPGRRPIRRCRNRGHGPTRGSGLVARRYRG